MKISELKNIIREAVEEVTSELKAEAIGLGVAEGTPPNFPSALKKKIIAQYGNKPKAYATMWTLHKKMEEGNKRVCEMWTAWEAKSMKEAEEASPESQEEPHDETDLSNPEESKEVELAKKLQDLVNKLLVMHGVGEEEAPEGEEEVPAEEPADEEEPIAEAEEGDEEVVPEAGEESDMDNPEENEEVQIAREIKSIANELLAMHGVEDEDTAEAPEGEEAVDEEPTAEEPEQLTEKWGKKNVVKPSKKDMFKGKTKAELTKQLNNLKKKGPHKKGSKEFTKMKELQFAIRAKSGWGKVKES